MTVSPTATALSSIRQFQNCPSSSPFLHSQAWRCHSWSPSRENLMAARPRVRRQFTGPLLLAIGETVISLTLSMPIETPTTGRGGCSRMTVSPTARQDPRSAVQRLDDLHELCVRHPLFSAWVFYYCGFSRPDQVDKPHACARTHCQRGCSARQRSMATGTPCRTGRSCGRCFGPATRAQARCVQA